MNKQETGKQGSVDALLESVRKLRAQNAEGFRRLVEEIAKDTELGLSKEIIVLARSLDYPDEQLIEAIDSCGLIRTYGFLRREAERRNPKPPVTVH